MTATSARLIELLQLLQSRRTWTGDQLARRLGVSARTIRSNVAQLRELGIPVEATPGVAGGYELGAGSRMAPLLLDDDEAVATAVALRVLAGTGLSGADDAAVGALAKLAQVLPERLRGRIGALHDSIEPLRWGPGGQVVTSEALLELSQACRDRVQVRFDYVDREGAATTREVEPYALVPDGSRWYLVAFDLDRHDWRTFRVDRARRPRMLRRRAATRELPADDAATYVRDSIRGSRPRKEVVVRLDVDVEAARAAFGSHLPGELEPDGTDHCTLIAEVEHHDWFVFLLTWADLPFEVVGPTSFADRVATLAERFDAAAGHPDRDHPAPAVRT